MYVLRRFSDGRAENRDLGERMVLIGGSPDCDIILRAVSAPEVAARIDPDGEGFIVSSVKVGAVRLNGKKVRREQLRAGDRLEIATECFVFDVREAPSVPAPIADSFPAAFARFVAAVGEERDLRKLLKNMISILFELIGGTDAFVFVLDTDGKPQVFVSSAEQTAEERFSDTIVQEVLSTGRGVFIPNALSDPRFSGSRSIVDLRLSSVLCCPIRIAGKTVGVVYLGSKKATTSYRLEDLDTMGTYAMVAGMLINHVAYISHQSAAIRRLVRVEEQQGIVAESKVMRGVLNSVDTLAGSDIVVLLEGETGTGKDLIAQMIHKKSVRLERPMVVVNCSSLRGELLESELFGHRKGSFTGAVRDHRGLFEAANGGTLFLDEIGEMDMALQSKLLRTIETGLIRAVGSSDETLVDVRVVCATNRNLARMVEEGTFRKDLYYRINQFRLELPPLREREDDAVLLAYYFLEKYRVQYPAKGVVDFRPEAIDAIRSCEWPGNVRELASAVHKAVLSSGGPMLSMDIGPGSDEPTTYETAMAGYQRKLLAGAIRACGGNKERAAKKLGLSRSTFFRYLASAGDGS